MISGTVVYGVTTKAAQLFAPPGVKVSIYNASPTQTVWLSTRGNVAVGLGIPLPPNGLIAWDADKACYAVAPADVLVAVTDNSGALNFQGPTLTQITTAVPTAAAIDAQPNSANAAASAAAALTAAAAAATNAANALTAAATAASNSAVARIRSMTRVSFSFSTTDTTVTVAISLTDVNRAQVSLVGTFVTAGSTAGAEKVPGIASITNSLLTLNRGNSGVSAGGYVEIMEWI